MGLVVRSFGGAVGRWFVGSFGVVGGLVVREDGRAVGCRSFGRWFGGAGRSLVG